MSRLFTFGCSFTMYNWPTWADILGKEFEFVENWGHSGGGNQFIFNSVVECSLRHKFTPGDTIIIMWTNISREDKYVNNKWLFSGNMYTTNLYSREYKEKYTDLKGFLIRDLAFIHSTKKYLEFLNVKHIFLSMVPITNWDQYNATEIKHVERICDLYKDTLSFIRKSVFEVIYRFNWDSKERVFRDFHPTPELHLQYLQTIVPEYNISPSTVAWVKEVEQSIIEQSKSSCPSANQLDLTKYWKYVVPDRF